MPNRTNLSISFYGAAQTTTGSRHLLSVGDKTLLLDCGLYQGHRKESVDRNLRFQFPPSELDAMVLSHAHIDHSGNLPNLVKQGYGGSIYSTPATAALCRVMLRDSAHIQEKDAEWLNRRNAKRGSVHGAREPIVPLYTSDDAELTLTRFVSSDYEQPFGLLQDAVSVKFIEAGHILGSAGVLVDIKRAGASGAGERPYRLAFSGDIGRKNLPLLRDPEFPEGADWLIMESTYGDRTHAPIGEAKERLRDVITRTAARGGKVIIPSFSVERTQEVVYLLNQLTDEGKLPPVPVFVDSPLAVNVTEIFRIFKELLDAETRKWVEAAHDPFGFDRLTYVRDVEESKKLNELRMPCVIISASGMCEAGRILHHLRNNIEDGRNCVLFVGYQAEGTLGRAIVEKRPEVNILGETRRVKAEVVSINSMSGHADMNDLFEYARQAKERGPLKRIFLVHGETKAQETLAARLRGELQMKVDIPAQGDKFELEG